ncbi:glycosyltransferase family 4 protein [Halomonas sp. 5021]|uniref:glycosyltransferase family 4 protein n=1 Tax=Halomonas sp. 5021 TaxID=3082156 RepID=UPI002FC80596
MKPLNILLLSFYYPPDISAGAFRAEALVNAFERLLPSGSQVHVLASAPNRVNYAGGKAALACETQGLATIERLTLPGGGRGLGGQARAFASYARQVKKRVQQEDYDLVVATSSRLVTTLLGRWMAKRCGAALYLDIRDNFVENLPYVLPYKSGWGLAPVFALAERWALSGAQHINLVSGGFAAYFEKRYPSARFSYHTNGIDLPFVQAVEQGAFAQSSNPVVSAKRPVEVLYAGNLGVGQGIEYIVPPLAHRLGSRVRFRIIGDGGGAAALSEYVATQGLDNVVVELPVSRDTLIKAYQDADVLFLHLNTLPSLYSVLPSKIFEYAATGKPMWGGLPGYSARFVSQEIDNAAVFPPGSVDGAIKAFEQLAMGITPRQSFVAQWRRDKIMNAMVSEMMMLVSHEA